MHSFVGKSPRLQYVNTPKLLPQSETSSYNKYSTVPPSQTAPETVSLLQQPIQNSKYASTVVIQGRGGFGREKVRQRPSQYSSPQVQQNNQYQGYQAMSQSGSPVSPQGYESRSVSVRQSAQQLQYLQLNQTDSYKTKNVQATVSPRSFKMPSPPLVPVTSPQMSNAAGANTGSGSRSSKEQFRSHSLPLGAQLNLDWTVSVPAPPAPSTHDVAPAKHIARAREPNPSAIRIRSRSSSSGVVAESAAPGSASGASGGPAGASGSSRRPPPLNSVASEPTLPQASVMLAQLLSAQHSQSLYKLNSEEGSSTTDPTRSPIRRAQPSPIGSDVMSPHQSLSPPTSPGGGSPRAGSPRESRRTHLHAEQKRRYNIKNGFDTLQALIPHLNTNPAAKISKAAMLQKGAEYIKQLKAERNQIKEEMESLRQQIECLNNSITNCHSLLPATGAPVSRARSGRLREMFARHVANRTLHNWKYWLFSVVSAALVESFSACVSCSSAADLVRTTLLWAEQHCSLVEMRPAVLNSLRVLCTTTDILTSPERLPEEARAAVAASAGVKTEPT
ncbi:unnamed protein product [Arctia plantaginis]|nr:unnamed protein product [Arctia plantaginis]